MIAQKKKFDSSKVFLREFQFPNTPFERKEFDYIIQVEKNEIFCHNVNCELTGKMLEIKENFSYREGEKEIEFSMPEKLEFIESSICFGDINNIRFIVKIRPVECKSFNWSPCCPGYEKYTLTKINVHPSVFG